MISEIVAPESAQQIYLPPPQPPPVPRLDATDLRIVEAVRDVGPVKLWSLLNWLTENEGARSRGEGRQARLDLWRYRIKRLKQLGLVFGHGRNEVAATKSSRQPARPRPRWRRRSVRESPGVSAVSVDKSPSPHRQPVFDYLVERHLTAMDSVMSHGIEKPEKTESVITSEKVSVAARTLAKLPRRPQPRKLTGLLHGRRCWRGQPILLPGQQRAFVWGCQRRKVVWSLDPKELSCSVIDAGVTWGVLPESVVTREKCEAAMLLGSRKRGVREKPSERKRLSARRNGAAPARRGRRGRPPRLAPWAAAG